MGWAANQASLRYLFGQIFIPLQVDVGNLIIDLDADIDKAMSSAAASAGGQQASAVVGSNPAQAAGLNPNNQAASQQGQQQPSMPPGSMVSASNVAGPKMKTLVTSKG